MIPNKPLRPKSECFTDRTESVLFAAAALVILVLTWPFWNENQIPAFRDTLHFYYPFWHYLDGQPWRDRLLPGWNRLDAFGSCGVSDPTTMTFYPGRWLLLLPGLGLGNRIGLFLAAHLMLAYASTWWLSRRLGFGPHAAHVAAVSYALGGPVYFQIYNPVYLVGASWLPWMLWCTLAILFRHASSRGVLGLSVGMAMCNLGGDPQSAAHVSLLGGVLWILGRFAAWRLRWERGAWFLLALALAAGLSLPQLLPTIAWSLDSGRWAKAAEHAYDFSVPPWHWITLVFPNSLGTHVAGNSRWIEMVPAEGRMWVPSLHLGTLPFLLLVTSLGFRHRMGLSKSSLSSSMAVVLVVALASAAGNYSLLWVLKQCQVAPSSWYSIDDAVTGLQWFWNNAVPGYRLFRYPAKWLPAAMLVLSCAAAQGVDRLIGESKRCHRSAASWLMVGGLALGVGGWMLTSIAPLHAWFQRACLSAAEDPLTGPLDCDLARWTLMASGLHVAVAAGLWWVFLRWSRLSRPNWRLALAMLATLELTCLAAWNTVGVSESLVRSGPTDRPPSTAAERVQHSVNLQNRFLHGRLHLINRVPNLEAQFSIEPRALAELRQWMEEQPRWRQMHALRRLGWDHSFAPSGLSPWIAQVDWPRWMSLQAWPIPEDGRRSPDSVWEALVALDETRIDSIAYAWRVMADELLNAPSQAGRVEMDWTSSSAAIVRLGSTQGEQSLVLRQLPSSGWCFTNDNGQRLRSLAVNELLTAVLVPAGTTQVRMRYTAPGLAVGCWLGGVLWLALLLRLTMLRFHHSFRTGRRRSG
jgi:hypothetical protein